MRRHTFLWLAAALVLTSMGAAEGRRKPRCSNLVERMLNTARRSLNSNQGAEKCLAEVKHAGRNNRT